MQTSTMKTHLRSHVPEPTARQTRETNYARLALREAVEERADRQFGVPVEAGTRSRLARILTRNFAIGQLCPALRLAMTYDLLLIQN